MRKDLIKGLVQRKVPNMGAEQVVKKVDNNGSEMGRKGGIHSQDSRIKEKGEKVEGKDKWNTVFGKSAMKGKGNFPLSPIHRPVRSPNAFGVLGEGDMQLIDAGAADCNQPSPPEGRMKIGCLVRRV